MTEKEIEKHKIAAKKLGLIKDKAFNFIKRNLGKISEYDVQKFILSEFKKEGLVTLWSDKKYTIRDEKNPALIIAVNENSAIVHYFPKKRTAKIIKKDNLILIDIWARLNKEYAPFADITWVAYSGKKIPKEIGKIFSRVIEARDFTINFIKKSLKNKKFPKTSEVEVATRNYFKKLNLDKYFLHRTGHSLGLHICHGKYFRFDKKSKTRIKPNIPFTIEPGLYFKNKFGGIRSEIDCYVTEDYKLIVTTKIQNKIIEI